MRDSAEEIPHAPTVLVVDDGYLTENRPNLRDRLCSRLTQRQPELRRRSPGPRSKGIPAGCAAILRARIAAQRPGGGADQPPPPPGMPRRGPSWRLESRCAN